VGDEDVDGYEGGGRGEMPRRELGRELVGEANETQIFLGGEAAEERKHT
jgi:hypothetical protein